MVQSTAKDHLEKISSSSEHPWNKRAGLVFICFPFFFLPPTLTPGRQGNTKL